MMATVNMLYTMDYAFEGCSVRAVVRPEPTEDEVLNEMSIFETYLADMYVNGGYAETISAYSEDDIEADAREWARAYDLRMREASR